MKTLRPLIPFALASALVVSGSASASEKTEALVDDTLAKCSTLREDTIKPLVWEYATISGELKELNAAEKHLRDALTKAKKSTQTAKQSPR